MRARARSLAGAAALTTPMMKEMMIVDELSEKKDMMLSMPCSAAGRGDTISSSSSSSGSAAVGVSAGDGERDLLLLFDPFDFGDGDGDLLLRAGGDLRGVRRVLVAPMGFYGAHK